MSAPQPRCVGRRLFAATLILALLAAGCASTPPEDVPEPQLAVSPEVIASAPPPAPPPPDPVPLRPTAPERYVVQPGDTLWDISSTFLRDPWYWPEIWVANPQIANPHLIYPGDILSLYHVDGRPRLTVDGGPRVRPTLRLSPQVREEPLPPALDVPIQALQQFLIRPRVVTQAQLDESAYLMAARDDRLIFGAHDCLYARGLKETTLGDRYDVFRTGDILMDPDSGEMLGHEAIPVGVAELVREGDPATVLLVRSDREALIGDRLLPQDSGQENFLFTPAAPPRDSQGRIISLFDAISQIARFQVAVINLGEREGIVEGHVFATYQSGRVVHDRLASRRGEAVTLPDERVGLIMVFRTFEKVSYALVMESTHPIERGFTVKHP
ncbi:LysM domain-containing protein [Ectothiorhodospira magna]|uniref:LysM domain-containing protein n=1 Tax=Ectothiorhodospira magna TaxID=867345 RepID=A0A1H9FJA0_9GAMM|nr:LysM peptidoglycan-binding domain-containing protein [Ectothiorhodospira magna]SEQ37972.1 LysM domain-containing protein [Ectothiorhodospira magna]